MSMLPLSKTSGFLTLRRKGSYSLMSEAAVEKIKDTLNGYIDSTGQNRNNLVISPLLLPFKTTDSHQELDILSKIRLA